MPTIFQLFSANPMLLVILVVWTLPWKGWALWRAARRGDRNWFIVMLILNTAAILEIVYLFIVTHHKEREEGATSSEDTDLSQ